MNIKAIGSNYIKKGVAIATSMMALGFVAANTPKQNNVEQKSNVVEYQQSDNYGRTLLNLPESVNKDFLPKKQSYNSVSTMNVNVTSGNNNNVKTVNETVYSLDKGKNIETSVSFNKTDTNNQTNVEIGSTLKNQIPISDKLNNSGSSSISLALKNTDTEPKFLSSVNNLNTFMGGIYNPQLTLKANQKLTYKPIDSLQMYSQISNSVNINSDIKSGNKTLFGNIFNFNFENGLNFEKIFFKRNNISIKSKNDITSAFNYKNTKAYSTDSISNYDWTTGLKSAISLDLGKWANFNLSGSGQFVTDNEENKTFKNGYGLSSSFIPFQSNPNLKLSCGGDYSLQKSLTEDNKSTETITLSSGINVSKDVKLSGQYQKKNVKSGKKETETQIITVGTDVNLNKNTSVSGKCNINLDDNQKNNLTISTKIRY